MLLLFIALSSSNSYSTSSDSNINDPILEITDKYSEIRLGITDSKIYMVISDTYREYANQQFLEQHRRDIDFFTDSNGSFLIAEATYLETNTLEFDIEDVEAVLFEDGELIFKYRNKFQLGFEEVLSLNGINALSSFYVEDLELFAITFKNLS